MWFERSKEMEIKGAAGASEAGVILNRFEGKAAPSGAFPITGGICWAMMELRGGARPRIQTKEGDRDSDRTTSAAAVGES
jgi:hypothetical protein